MSKLENVKTPENPSGAINLRYTRTLLYHFAGIFISSCSHLQIRRCEPDRSMNKQRLVLKTSKYIIAAYPVLLMDRSRSEEHTSELQSRFDIVCRLLLEKK